MLVDNKNVPAHSINPVFGLAVKFITGEKNSFLKLSALIADPNKSDKKELFYQDLVENEKLQEQIAEEQAIMQLIFNLEHYLSMAKRKADDQLKPMDKYLLVECVKEDELQIDDAVAKLLSNLYQEKLEQQLVKKISDSALAIYKKFAAEQVQVLAKSQTQYDGATPDYQCFHVYQMRNDTFVEKLKKIISSLQRELNEKRRCMGDNFAELLDALQTWDDQDKSFASICQEHLSDYQKEEGIKMLSLFDADCDGQTLLHFATKRAYTDYVEELIKLAARYEINIFLLLDIKSKEDVSPLDNIVKQGSIEILKVVLPYIPLDIRHDILRKFVRNLLITIKCSKVVVDEESRWPLILYEYAMKNFSMGSNEQRNFFVLVGMLLDVNALCSYYFEYARKEREKTTTAFLNAQNQSIAKKMLENLFNNLLEYVAANVSELILSDFIQHISTPFFRDELGLSVKRMVQYENRQPTKIEKKDTRTLVDLARLESWHRESIKLGSSHDQVITEGVFIKAVCTCLQKALNESLKKAWVVVEREPFIRKILADLEKFLNDETPEFEQVKKIIELCQFELKIISTLSKLESLPGGVTVKARYERFRETILQLLDACVERFQYADEDLEREALIHQIVFKEYMNWISGCADFDDILVWLQSLGKYIDGFLVSEVKVSLSGNLHGILDEGKVALELNEVLGQGFLSANFYDSEFGNLLHVMLQHIFELRSNILEVGPMMRLVIYGSDLFRDHYYFEENVLPIDYMVNEFFIEDDGCLPFIYNMLERMGWQLAVELALWDASTDEVAKRESMLNGLSLLRGNVLIALKEKLENGELSCVRKVGHLKSYVECLKSFYQAVKERDSSLLYGYLTKVMKDAKRSSFVKSDFLDAIDSVRKIIQGSEQAEYSLSRTALAMFSSSPPNRTSSNSSTNSNSPPASPEKTGVLIRQ